MTKYENLRRLVTCAGLIFGPLLWAMNTQLGEILPYAECGSSLHPMVLISILATSLSLVSGYVSWRNPWSGCTGRFWSAVCALLGLVFSFALLLQTGASLVLTGCER
jgi:hypothetical protein